jgi:hypothetical protein
MRLSNREIADNLEECLNFLGGTKYLINPFFRVSKATPEQMQQYKFINLRFPRIKAIFSVFISIPTNFLLAILYMSLSVILRHQYTLYNSRIAKSDILFLSHAIGDNITKNKGDQFFTLMPEYISNLGLKATIIYTNHVKLNYFGISRLLFKKTSKVNSCVLPKLLRPLENTKLIYIACLLSFKCFKSGVTIWHKDPVKSALLIKGSARFLNRQTYNNYLILTRVKEYYIKSAARTIVMTFEGHSYEHYVAVGIKSSQEPKVVFYQHSPIVPDHFGIKYFLQSYRGNLHILTTGLIYKNYFKGISTRPNYIVLGSDKSISISTSINYHTKNKILFAPEGTVQATHNFLKLISDLCKANSKYEFILRLHPNLTRSLKIIVFINKLNRFSNFSISSETLSTDLAKSNYIFYRSSAVGVQALASAAIPVFYSDAGQNGLNVLSFTTQKFPAACNSREVLELLANSNREIPIEKRIEVLDQLLAKIQYRKLNFLI